MPTVYKQFTPQQAESRTTTALNSTDKTNISNILGNFVTYFKAKHS